MAGKVILVRHAHALHNVHSDLSIHDPKLTLRGQRESVQLTINASNPMFKNVGCIYTSPLQRAIHTTLLAFIEIADKSFYLNTEGNKSRGAELILEPLLQEINENPVYPANTGSDIEILQTLWPNLEFEPLQKSNWPQNYDANQRAAEFLEVLDAKVTQLSNATNGKRDVVVVTHGGILQILTDPDAVQFGLATAKEYKVVTEGGNRRLKAV